MSTSDRAGSADEPQVELERRYRRVLRWYPPGERTASEEELVAVLLQTAAPGQRRPDPGETTALLIHGTRLWVRAAMSADRTANHQAAAALSIVLPLMLTFPSVQAWGSAALEMSPLGLHQHHDLIAWAVWSLAALCAGLGPAGLPRWIAGTATLGYLAWLLPHVRDGDTGVLSTGAGWLALQVTACGLLLAPRRVRAGRRLLRRHWRSGALAAAICLALAGGPGVITLLGLPVDAVSATCSLGLIVLGLIGLRSPAGRAALTVCGPLFAGFVAGHGWSTGIGGIAFFEPTSNYPDASTLSWLVVLPAITWAALRVLSGVAQHLRSSPAE